MMWVSLILLILLGVLGIAGWLKSRRPEVGAQLGQLQAVEGWIGLIGLIWGLVLLIRWITALQYIGYAPGVMVVALVSALVIAALSLILSLPLLRSLIGENAFTKKLGELTAKMQPFKVGLGAACLVLALYSLVIML